MERQAGAPASASGFDLADAALMRVAVVANTTSATSARDDDVHRRRGGKGTVPGRVSSPEQFSAALIVV